VASVKAAGDTRATAVAAPLRRQVVELLRKSIIEQEFLPGQRLLERDLVERFGVSRTVIREALRQCESEGLVEMRPNHGPVVFSATFEQAREIYEARTALEATLSRYCAERAGAQLKRRLGRLLAQVEKAYDAADLAESLRVKDELYRTIAEGAANSILAHMLATINIRVQALRRLSLEVPGRREASLAELQAVIDAIVAGDGDTAAQRASEHVENAAAAALASFDRSERPVE